MSAANWAVGQTVTAGFLSVVVRAELPADGRHTAYLVSNAAGTKLYRFTPYTGIRAVSLIEARELLAESKAQADRVAARAAAKAAADAKAIADINDILFSAA